MRDDEVLLRDVDVLVVEAHRLPREGDVGHEHERKGRAAGRRSVTVIDVGAGVRLRAAARAVRELVGGAVNGPVRDGNEVAGIRLPDIAVPLATYTGWNEYKPPYPRGEIADRDGSCLPFPADKIAARYRNRAGYVAEVQKVIEQLRKDGFLLPEDAERYLEKARNEARVPA